MTTGMLLSLGRLPAVRGDDLMRAVNAPEHDAMRIVQAAARALDELAQFGGHRRLADDDELIAYVHATCYLPAHRVVLLDRLEGVLLATPLGRAGVSVMGAVASQLIPHLEACRFPMTVLHAPAVSSPASLALPALSGSTPQKETC